MSGETEGGLPCAQNRHKFMIQDILDMRSNRWQARRKVEGPKMIGEIHRDAEREQYQVQMNQRSMDRYGGGRGRGPGGFREHPMRGPREQMAPPP